MIALGFTIKRMMGIVVVVSCLAPGVLDVWAGSVKEKCKLVSEYGSRISLVDKELFSLKENLAWLEIKIGQIQGGKNEVPRALAASVAHKKERISLLQHTRRALAGHLERVRAFCPDGYSPCAAGLYPPKELAQAGLECITDGMGQMVVKSKTSVLFASGSARVAPKFFPMLKKISAFIQSHQPWVVVDGFADMDPIKNQTFPSNFELGAVRAANIVHALVGFGADPARFKVATTGKYRFPSSRPMSGDKDRERYVDIKLISD